MSDGDTPTDVITVGDRAVNEPADRALGYGKQAVDPGKTKTTKPPAKKPKPTPLELAQQALDAYAQGEPKYKGVRLHAWSSVPNPLIRAFNFGAWTNSPTDIYVGPGVTNAQLAEETIHHELQHIDQFVDNGGKVPASYEAMVEYEYGAYVATVNYFNGRFAATKVKWYKAAADREEPGMLWFRALLDKLDELKNNLTGDPLEKFIVQELVGGEFLPAGIMSKDKTKVIVPVGALYKP